MASWDTVVSLKQLLDSYSEATGHTYILLVAQGDETTPRVIAKAMSAFPSTGGANVLSALGDAAEGIFDEIADYLGPEEDPDA